MRRVDDDSGIKAQPFDFVAISDLEQCGENSMVDILGVCTAASAIGSINTKKGSQLDKRSIVLGDSTGKSVEVTLWGEEAQKNEEHKLVNQIVAIKSARVSYYRNRTLSTSFQSRIHINPSDNPDAQRLRHWCDSNPNFDFQSVSNNTGGTGGSGGAGGADSTQRKFFASIKQEQLGTASSSMAHSRALRKDGGAQNGDYITVRGTVVYYRHDEKKPPWYMACTNLKTDGKTKCAKKATEQPPTWFCASCNKTTHAEPRYVTQ